MKEIERITVRDIALTVDVVASAVTVMVATGLVMCTAAETERQLQELEIADEGN